MTKLHNTDSEEDLTSILDENKALDNRLATIEGHIRAVRKMLLADKDCIEVIIQLMAIEKSVKKVGMTVLKNHLDHCVKETVEGCEGGVEAIESFNRLLEMYL